MVKRVRCCHPQGKIPISFNCICVEGMCSLLPPCNCMRLHQHMCFSEYLQDFSISIIFLFVFSVLSFLHLSRYIILLSVYLLELHKCHSLFHSHNPCYPFVSNSHSMASVYHDYKDEDNFLVNILFRFLTLFISTIYC